MKKLSLAKSIDISKSVIPIKKKNFLSIDKNSSVLNTKKTSCAELKFFGLHMSYVISKKKLLLRLIDRVN